MICDRHMVVFVLVTALSLGLFPSCNKFEYGYDESESDMVNPNESKIEFDFVWDRVDVEDRPEDMTVLMSRKVHSLNYCYRLGAGGEVIAEVPDSSADKTLSVANGEYYLMAFSDGEGFYSITDYSSFCEGNALTMKEIYADVPSISEEDIFSDKNIVDFNSYSGYVVPADKPLFLYLNKNLFFPQSAGHIALNPVDLTRLFTFSLQLETEAGVSVDRVVAVLSGVPHRVQLMSGLVSRVTTSKVAFDMYLKEDSGGVYEGQVRTFGLLSSQDKTMVVGPGILQVSVFARVHDGAETISRVFYAGINLKRQIDSAGIMIPSEDNTGYIAAPQGNIKPFRIAPVLKVMRSHIEAEEGNGSEVWFENDAEINPEV